LNKFLLLHKLTINRVTTLPTVCSGYSELYCQSGARSVASRELQKKTMERSGARSRRSRSGNEAGSGGYRNRLESGAVFSWLT